MRRISKKRQQRIAETGKYRQELVSQVGACMLCGTNPTRHRYGLPELNNLCCHEILNGPDRDKVLMEPSCLIVACWYCNGYELVDKKKWPLSRQLWIIKTKAPERYDLKRVLDLRKPEATRFVTEEEVDAWNEK